MKKIRAFSVKIVLQLFMTLNHKILQYIKNSFEDVQLNINIYWISPASLWNSSTLTVLRHGILPATKLQKYNSHCHEQNFLTWNGVTVSFQENRKKSYSNINAEICHWTLGLGSCRVVPYHNSQCCNTFIWNSDQCQA